MSIKIFTARRIITMNPSWPEGTAVAVRDGLILEVGTLESLAPWLNKEGLNKEGLNKEGLNKEGLDSDEVEMHDFGDQVMLPGLIDPHLHPVMAAVLLPMHFITALAWQLPWDQVPACPDRASYLQRLSELEQAQPEGEPFFTWGYHQSWHGEMSRQDLDEISTVRPMVVWHRSFHEVYLNTAMLALMEITEDKVGAREQIDFERGHFYEVGLGYAIRKLNKIIMSPEWITDGLSRLKEIVHLGGHTTVGDMAVGLFDYELERKLGREIIDNEDVPFRVLGVPHAQTAARLKGGHSQVIAHMDELLGTDTKRLRHSKHIKVFTDGAFFSQLAMLQPPGYVDGHHGEWLTTPEEFESIVREYWQAEYAIHVHCTGDLGLELALDTLAVMQSEKPRFNHGYTIEHFGFSTPEQVHRMKMLGASVSANVYYLHELSDRYATDGVGFERAYTMARLGSCIAEGLTTAIHSDFPMAPATPLRNAWIACTRENEVGDIAGEQEKLSVYDGLKAITIDAARVLGMDDEIGSIRAGKIADFTVVDGDPLVDGANSLKSLSVSATVFAGEIYPIKQV